MLGLGEASMSHVTSVRCARAVLVLVLVLVLGCKGGSGPAQVANGLWTGTVDSITHAGSDAQAGLEVCDEGGCHAAPSGTAIPSGTRLSTDGRTRARIKLADGSAIVVDRDSAIELLATGPRAARLTRGAVAIDTPAAAGAARLELPQGRVDANDARFEVVTDDKSANVTVAHGAVRLHDAKEAEGAAGVGVLAGEEARIGANGAIALATGAPRSELAELPLATTAPPDGPRGVGELRAKLPGEPEDKSRHLRVAKHAITARISDAFARTEIEEIFANDSGDELEGVYRFPLPPDAQIESLSLEVDGKLVPGAFVERDKAKRIWKGAEQTAIDARQVLTNTLEILWHPGPWRDPALLEWQRGGRFELKIFPIGAKSSRRVVLAYTQALPPGPGTRRYAYALAYDPNAPPIGAFSADVQVIGHAHDAGVAARGYAFQTAPASCA
jgi:hypothetical protein